MRQRVGRVATLSLGHAVNDSYAYVLQASLPAIIASLGLTLGMAGGLVSLYQLTSSLVQPVVGYLADRSALRWPAWAGVALSGVATGLLGLAPSYLALVGLLLLAGVGTSIFHPVSAAMAGASAPARSRGRWLGLYVTAGNFGLALGPLMVGSLAAAYGLRGTWPIMLPALVVAALVGVMAPRRGPPGRDQPDLPETLRRHWRMLGSLVVVVGLRASAAAATVSFIPLLARQRGATIDQGAHILTAYLVAGALGGLVGGFAADRWGRDRVIIASLLLSVPFGLVAALTTDAGLLFAGAAALAGFMLNGSFVVLTIRGQESVPGSVGMVSGIMLGLSVGLGGLAVTPLAILAEQAGLPVAAAVAAGLGLAAAAAMLLVPAAPGGGARPAQMSHSPASRRGSSGSTMR
jgi:MFS transporter, FSR family, fosmidomycin resistance protein